MNLPYARDALRGRVAVVAGATRGAGRGLPRRSERRAQLSFAPGGPAVFENIKSDYDRS